MKPIVSRPGEGEVFTFERDSLARYIDSVTDTEGAFEAFEREIPPYTIGADPHAHAATVESLYVLEGRATILCSEHWREYEAGSLIVVPRNTPHGFVNDTAARVRLLISFVPGVGHEAFFAELARLKRGPAETYAQDLAQVRKRFDTQSVAGLGYVFRAQRTAGGHDG
jgi:mannose-6-phosphate isomerase-like protein (cupin superfamily)